MSNTIDTKEIADCKGYKTEREANAAFIVRACNAHDELVGLVSQILEQGLINDPEFYIEAVKILAKAKGE